MMATTTPTGEKLRKMAAGLTARIESLRGNRLENTPKRQCQGMSARCEANNLERVQRALEALADGWDGEFIPPALAHLKTKAAVEPLVTKIIEHPSYYVVCESDKWRSDTEEARLLRSFVHLSGQKWAEADADRAKADRVRRLEEEIKFTPIPGFFPTPPELIRRMILLASIPDNPQTWVLEPSAGKGDIVEAIREAAPNATVHYCEIVPRLREIVFAKTGVSHDGTDFMEYDKHGYHRILMNPPFENGQDWKHVRHAYDLLAEGGRLVAIVSASVDFHKNAQGFRDWLDTVDHTIEDNDPDAFKGAFRSTGVSTRLLVIDK